MDVPKPPSIAPGDARDELRRNAAKREMQLREAELRKAELHEFLGRDLTVKQRAELKHTFQALAVEVVLQHESHIPGWVKKTIFFNRAVERGEIESTANEVVFAAIDELNRQFAGDPKQHNELKLQPRQTIEAFIHVIARKKNIPRDARERLTTGEFRPGEAEQGGSETQERGRAHLQLAVPYVVDETSDNNETSVAMSSGFLFGVTRFPEEDVWERIRFFRLSPDDRLLVALKYAAFKNAADFLKCARDIGCEITARVLDIAHRLSGVLTGSIARNLSIYEVAHVLKLAPKYVEKQLSIAICFIDPTRKESPG